jgi:hypothetical protein
MELPWNMPDLFNPNLLAGRHVPRNDVSRRDLGILMDLGDARRNNDYDLRRSLRGDSGILPNTMAVSH